MKDYKLEDEHDIPEMINDEDNSTNYDEEGFDMGSLQPVKEDTTSPTSPQIKQDLAEVDQQGPEETILIRWSKSRKTQH